ncbi:MAG TPA: response regulator [Flavisolibacter sp.]
MSGRYSFLLVDDDADDISLFGDVLNEVESGIELKIAMNGVEALEKLGQLHPDLPDIIFLDLNMPRMEGLECLREIKASPQFRHIPVIMYTTSSLSKDIEEAMMSGAICFITKPTHVKELKFILSSIAGSLPGKLESTLRSLSNSGSTFIVC